MLTFASKSENERLMTKKNPLSAIPSRDELFREKGQSYTPCYSGVCPMKDRCLHAVLSPYAQTTSPTIRTVNLHFPGAETAQCMMFRSSEPIRMPVGLHPMYHDMPGHLERTIKNLLIKRYSRKRYYEYHNGTRPLPPAEEAYVRQLLIDQGWHQEPHFASYEEDYLW